MTFHQLHIFDAVAKYQNVSKAAQEVRISQPSLSKQLRLLEEEFGLKLHQPVIGRGIKLTQEGRDFWKAIQPLLHQFGQIKKQFSPRPTHSPSLLVGATQGPSVSFVPEALKALQKRYPHVKPTLRTGNSQRLEEILLNAEIEVAVVVYPSNHPRLQVKPLHQVTITAVVSQRHPLAKKKKNPKAEEILNAPFIVKMGGKILELIEETGLGLHIALQCESVEGVKAAVQSGVGVGLLYRENVEHGLREGYFKALQIPGLDKLNLQWFVLHRKNETLSSNAHQFIELLKQRKKQPN